MNSEEQRKIYFDYAATTPLDKSVEEALLPYFREKFGNPSSLHFFGQEAIKAVDESREKIANAIGANFREIIFTGSATEANNFALRGVVKSLKIENLKLKIPRIVVSAVEHESVLDTARDLEKEGVEVVIIPMDQEGFVDIKKLKDSLNERTVLVSVMYANNEVGTVQPITEIAEIIREFKNLKIKIKNSDEKMYPLFHTDAVQALQWFNCNVDKLGVDLMTISSHKIYGPKGIGALYVRDYGRKILSPLITGGGQEFGFRSGTENVPLIVGFARAVELVKENREKENKRMKDLGSYFLDNIKKIKPKIKLNGGEPKLPNIFNIYFPGYLPDEILLKMDMVGIAVSAGSACQARSAEKSHVLRAIGRSRDVISSSVRFSFGRFTTKKDIDEALSRIKLI